MGCSDKMTCFGKYRGKVENNLDPQGLGRVQVSVPAVLGDGTLSWAMPCVPYAGSGLGFWAIPPKGAFVWVEFEGGNPDYPIWTGCFWGTKALPPSKLPDVKMFKTDSASLEFNDTPGGGGITLTVQSPAVSKPLTLKFSAQGIEINNNPAVITLNNQGIKLTTGSPSIQISPAKVDINNGALEVI